MATIADKLVTLVAPVHRHLRTRQVGGTARTREVVDTARTREVVCDECAEPFERSRNATSYGFPRLCRQCEMDD